MLVPIFTVSLVARTARNKLLSCSLAHSARWNLVNVSRVSKSVIDTALIAFMIGGFKKLVLNMGLIQFSVALEIIFAFVDCGPDPTNI